MPASIISDALMGIGCVTVFVGLTALVAIGLALRLGLLPEVAAVPDRLVKGKCDGT